MIIITYFDAENNEERNIEATGLGHLGWILDGMGCDVEIENDNFKVLSIELAHTKRIAAEVE